VAFNPSSKKKFVSDINVTPLVDVMLVLLIIFMISAPMLHNGIKLKLPQTTKVNKVSFGADQVVLSVSETGEYFIGKNKVLRDEIALEVNSMFKKNKQNTLFLRAHYTLKYGFVAKLIASLKNSGFSQISLVTEVEN
jgi:biopolymer transport protein ExbD